MYKALQKTMAVIMFVSSSAMAGGNFSANEKMKPIKIHGKDGFHVDSHGKIYDRSGRECDGNGHPKPPPPPPPPPPNDPPPNPDPKPGDNNPPPNDGGKQPTDNGSNNPPKKQDTAQPKKEDKSVKVSAKLRPLFYLDMNWGFGRLNMSQQIASHDTRSSDTIQMLDKSDSGWVIVSDSAGEFGLGLGLDIVTKNLAGFGASVGLLGFKGLVRLHGGLGIMADDVMAGVYGCVIVHLAIRLVPGLAG